MLLTTHKWQRLRNLCRIQPVELCVKRLPRPTVAKLGINQSQDGESPGGESGTGVDTASCGLDRRNGVTAPYACESRDLGIELFSFFANSQQMMNLFAAKLHR